MTTTPLVVTIAAEAIDDKIRAANVAELVNWILVILASPLTPNNNILLCIIENEIQRRKQEEGQC